MDAFEIDEKMDLLKTNKGRIAYLNDVLRRSDILGEDTVTSIYEVLHVLYKEEADTENAALAKAAVTEPDFRIQYRQKHPPIGYPKGYDPKKRFFREISEVLEPSQKESAREKAEIKEAGGNFYDAGAWWEEAGDYEKAAVNYERDGKADLQAAYCWEKAGREVVWEEVATMCLKKAEEMMAKPYLSGTDAESASIQLWGALDAFERAGNQDMVKEMYRRLYELGYKDDPDLWAHICVMSGAMSKDEAYLGAALEYGDMLVHELTTPIPRPEEGEDVYSFLARLDIEEFCRLGAAVEGRTKVRIKNLKANMAACYKEAGMLGEAADLFENAGLAREAIKVRKLMLKRQNQD